MKRRLTMAASMSVLLVATLLPGTAAARSPERSFGRVDTGGRTPSLDKLARFQDPNRKVQVYVELAGQPVALAVGAALDAGRQMSEAEKAALRQPLMNAQANLKTKLRTAGATINASYTDVLNAVRITVPASKLQKIAALPGVTKISRVPEHFRDNTNTVAFTGADDTWGKTGFTGRGVNVAIIDSGINYYHADFNGPGAAGFAADTGLDRTDGNFPTAKVIEGFDLVGDAYDGSNTPAPDNDPLDCKAADAGTVQHGTHVAGTAAGFGVRANGNTYLGPYNASTLQNTNFKIGPGTAPRAKLMAYRVFGCDGSTFVVVDAVERAVRDGADVINMSLGSPFGNPGSGDSVAVDNASAAGVTVVMSAGNSGPSAYITGSPGVATRGISVAAMDAVPGFPTVWIDMPTGADIRGINANGETADLPVTAAMNHFEDNPATPPSGLDDGVGSEHLGCNAADYAFNNFVAGQIAVVHRNVCARIARAQVGDAQGASAVIMINNSSGFPPFEGPIAGVDIPFIGVPIEDEPRFHTDDGGTATISEAPDLDNPNFKHTADFTSGGPRRLDSMIKPDVAAPGVGVFSADGSTTKEGKALSGTSMASPATAGIAALVLDAHPSWTPREVKAALIGTASPNKLDPYVTRLAGSGVVNPKRATQTTGLAFATIPGVSSLTYGAEQIGHGPVGAVAYQESLKLKIKNMGSSSTTYNLSNTFSTDSLGIDVSFSTPSVTVPAGSSKEFWVTLTMDDAEAAALPDTAPFHAPDLAFDDFGQLHSPLTNVAGAVIATPTSGGPGKYKVRVPWLVAPRGLSVLNDNQKSAYTETVNKYKSTVKVKNYGLHSGIADVYAFGLQDPNEGLDGIDIRAAGWQSLPTEICTGPGGEDSDDRCLLIAINTWNKWSNASENEFDVLIDTDEDGQPDFLVAGVDAGLVFGFLEGVYISVIVDLSTNLIVDAFLATAPNNGATMLLPVLASELGLDPAGDTDFDYWAESYEVYDDEGLTFQFDLALTGDTEPNGSELARYDAFDHPISNGDFLFVDPDASVTIPLSVSKTGYQPLNGMKGWMIVTMEDENGQTDKGQHQADLIYVGNLPD